MKLAILSDIHGNYLAFKACVDYIAQNDFDGIVLLGDYITDCPYPQKTIKLLKQVMKKYKTWAIRGNREQYMIDYRNKDITGLSYGSQTGSLLYTYENLTSADVDFFCELPITQTIEIEDCKPFAICHGSPDDLRCVLKPNTEITDEYLKNSKTDFLLCGHTHKPFVYNAFGKILINCGSVGCPTNGQTKSQFSSFEFANNNWKNELINVEYDINEMLNDFEKSGILEKGKMWAYSMMKLLKTGENYPVKCIQKAWELAQKDNSSETTETHWQQAAKELEII